MNATQNNVSVGSAVSGINYHSLIATGSINPMGLALCAGKLEEAITVMRMMGITDQGKEINFGGMVMKHLEDWAADMRERSIAMSGEALFNEMAKSVDAVAKAADAAAEKAQAAAKAEAAAKPSSNVAKAAAAMANVLASHEAAVQQTVGKAAPKAKKADPAPAAPAVKTPAQMAMAITVADLDKAAKRDWSKDAKKNAIYIANMRSVYFAPTMTDGEIIDAISAEIKRREKATKAAKAPAPKAKAAPTVSLPAPLDAIVKMPASEQWQAIVKMTADEVAAAAKALKIELVKNSMKNKSFILKAIQGK